MPDELLFCEKCNLQCVPPNLRNNVNDPVICVGCRMSNAIQIKNEYEEKAIQTTMHEINAKDHDWREIEFNSIINGMDEKKTYFKKAILVCPSCGEQEEAVPNDFYVTNIEASCRKGHTRQKMEVDMIQSRTEDIVTVLLEEPTEEAIHSHPKRYPAWVKGSLINDISIGARKRVKAVFKSIPKKDKTNDIMLDVVSFTDLEEKEECILSPEQVEDLKSKSKESNFVAQVRDSLSDKVGLEDIKLSLLISMVGGDCDVTERQDLHVLIMGDPSVAKSELLKFCHEMVPRSRLSSGESTGKVGIRGGIETLSNGSHIFVPGTVSMASGSILFIDEMDKTAKEDLNALLLAMEQQFVSYDKIIHIKLPAKTTIIAAANPKSGIYDEDQTLIQNFNLPYPLLSRFDLKWLVVDSSSEGRDTRIAKYTSSSYQKSEPFLSKKILSAYINHVRKLKPKMSVDADNHINSFWVQARKAKGEKKGGFRVDIRTLQSLRRIATAFAKLQFHEYITLDDATQATALYTRSMTSVGQDIVSGETTQTIFDGKKESKDKTFVDAINKLSKKDPLIDHNDLVMELINSGNYDKWDADKKIVDELRRGVYMIKTYDNKYRLSI